MGRPKTQKWEREASTSPIGRCEDCNKDLFTRRRSAINAGRARHGRSSHLNAYPCPHREGMWHFGRLPKMVVNGEATRADLVPMQRQRHAW